ncbi:MAG: hypothetical protein ICV72_06630, partial [Aldersonia sp.]|nr:hypothetical protein [Aldersonia sp.]
PGANTNLDSSGTNHATAVELARRSGSPIFLYLAGDFPQSIVEAADVGYAATMAPKLVGFGREVDRALAAAVPGTPVTYIGHSYGVSIVGTAEQEGLRADRVVYASSAGTGIHATEWHDPNPNVQRYSMTAPGDPIALSQSAPYNPHGANTLGGDPDEVPGVIRLDTGYYGATNPLHPDEVVFGPDGHGKYWHDPDSDAFRNLAGVISGGDVIGYVERGIEGDNVDIDVGDDGDFAAELYDLARAQAGAVVSGAELPGLLPRIPTFDGIEDPYGHPVVTDNPGRGPAIVVPTADSSRC